MDDSSIKRCSSVPRPRSRLAENSAFLIGSDLSTCSQLLKKRPVLLRIFRRRKIDTVLVTQFLFAETEERAKGWIHEERLPFQVLHCNPNGTRVENITEKLNVGRRRCICHGRKGIQHSYFTLQAQFATSSRRPKF